MRLFPPQGDNAALLTFSKHCKYQRGTQNALVFAVNRGSLLFGLLTHTEYCKYQQFLASDAESTGICGESRQPSLRAIMHAKTLALKRVVAALRTRPPPKKHTRSSERAQQRIHVCRLISTPRSSAPAHQAHPLSNTSTCHP